MRFLEPALGKIEIDEISISEVGFDDLRHKILYIPSVKNKFYKNKSLETNTN
jgi:ABC-type multidrug transport system, ATPase and permease components